LLSDNNPHQGFEWGPTWRKSWGRKIGNEMQKLRIHLGEVRTKYGIFTFIHGLKLNIFVP
jgi:hypothetical protein